MGSKHEDRLGRCQTGTRDAGAAQSDPRETSRLSSFYIRAKKLIKLVMRRGVLKSIKPSMLRKILGRTHEAPPSRAGERAANTDPPHSERSNVVDRQTDWSTDERINWLRRDRPNDCGNILSRPNARSIQTISPGLGISLETTFDLLDLRSSDQKTFSAPDQNDIGAGLIDRCPGRFYTCNGVVEVVKRLCFVTGRILDGKTRHTGFATELYVFGNIVRLICETILEIGVNRDVSRVD